MVQTIDSRRANRNQLLSSTDWLVFRHKEEEELILMGELSATTINSTEYSDLLKHRQSLRDCDFNSQDPDVIIPETTKIEIYKL